MSVLVNPLTQEPISDEEISGLSELVAQQEQLEERIAKGEELLKTLKAAHLDISTKLIPDKMDQLGFKSLTLSNGKKVNCQPFYSCKILSSDAFKWLDENGHGGIIKTEATRKFLRTEREEAVKFVAEHPEFQLKEEVHHQTLSAFTKEIYSKQEFLPTEHFQVYVGVKAKIS